MRRDVDWTVRLEGGPADGDHAQTDAMLPDKLWVGWCNAHDDWHWFSERTRGCEVYALVEADEDTLCARYVFEDPTGGLLDLERTKELIA